MTEETAPEHGSDVREGAESATRPTKRNVFHIFLGGWLMGVANIIPGVSGGTMLLAIGLYELFISSVADVTRLRFRLPTVIFLGVLGGGAVGAIFTMAALIEWGLTNHQHIMFALFIGLTLGGVPLLWRSLKPIRGLGVAGVVAGFLSMIAIAFALRELNLPANFPVMLMGGVVGSSAMVLPGISGSYLLLMMGLYSPVLEGISEFKDALQAVDIGAAMGPAIGVILPVGLGVVGGIALLTNAIKFVLKRYQEATIGTLLGLLLGSVVSLYPFRAPDEKDFFEQAAPATPLNIVIVLACIAAGFGLTMAIGRLGGKNDAVALPRGR